jgi:hypothetical protein
MTGKKEEETARRRGRRLAALGLLALAGLLLSLALSSAQQIHREGFEGRETVWMQGPADAGFKETAHRLTEDTAHSGQRSEQIQLEAQQGSFIHYTLDIGRAPVTDELNVSLFLKANRPGMQLLARLVLPHERHPSRPDEPLTAVVRGDLYQLAGRWQRLELRRPVKVLKDHQQLLRAELNRDIVITDAYVDRVILNVYGGPGLTDVWIDDLEVGPLTETVPFKSTGRPAPREGPAAAPRRIAVVQPTATTLLVNGKKMFFRATRHTDAPLKVLRDAGFNTVWFDEDVSASAVEDAVNLGFWIVPSLSSAVKQQQLTSTEALSRNVAQFLERDEVLFWNLGGGLAAEQMPAVARTVQLIRAADSRPVAADVWDGFQPFSRNVELLGVHRWPLMTGLELMRYREWLNQRRLLAQPGTFFWTWVQTHVPEWYVNLVSSESAPGARQDTLTSLGNQPAPAAGDLALAGPSRSRSVF